MVSCLQVDYRAEEGMGTIVSRCTHITQIPSRPRRTLSVMHRPSHPSHLSRQFQVCTAFLRNHRHKQEKKVLGFKRNRQGRPLSFFSLLSIPSIKTNSPTTINLVSPLNHPLSSHTFVASLLFLPLTPHAPPFCPRQTHILKRKSDRQLISPPSAHIPHINYRFGTAHIVQIPDFPHTHQSTHS